MLLRETVMLSTDYDDSRAISDWNSSASVIESPSPDARTAAVAMVVHGLEIFQFTTV